MIIYKVTNKIDGKMYIGQTVQTLAARWRDHIRGDKGRESQSYLYRAIAKHGLENFNIEQIDAAATLEGLNALEEHYIAKYDTLVPKGYNLLPGGLNRRLHQDTKDKLSAINKGKTIPNRWDKGFTGKHSEETKTIISQTLKGRPIKNRMNGAPKGRPVSEERRAQISKTMTGVAQPWKYKSITAVETGTVYESINHAAKALGLNRATISMHLKSGQTHKKTGLTFKLCNNKD